MIAIENGCICQTCAENGLECTQEAPSRFEDECDDCAMGIHQDERPDLNREGDPAFNGAFDRW